MNARHRSRAPRRGTGFALVPVVLVLSLVALATLLTGQAGGLGASSAGGRAEALQARYSVEAALAHAKWKLSRHSGCSGYPEIAATAFEGGSYEAKVNPKNNTPVNIKAFATTASGATASVERSLPKLDPSYTLTLQPGPDGEDTWIDSSQPDRNYGRGVDVRVTTNGLRALLRFDLSQLPAGSRVTSAALWLNQKTLPSGTGSLAVHRMTRKWTEGTAIGPANPPDGASWNGPDPARTWATAGGEFEAQAVATRPYTATLGWKTWDITSLVDGWAAGVLPNYGLVLRGVGDVQNVQFYSGDESTDTYARPKLVLTYSAPCGSTPPTVTTGLAAWWKLDEATGSSALDALGTSNGTISGATWTAGRKNGALQFNGSTDTILVPHNDALTLGSGLTLSAWIYIDAIRASQVILNKGTSGSNHNYYLMLTNRELSFGLYSGGFQTFTTSGLNLQTGTWYHVAATYDDAGNVVNLYLDGTQVYTGSTTRSLVANTEGLWIGRSQYGDNWAGRLDDIRIYNRALTSTEIGLVAGQTTLTASTDALLDGRAGFQDYNYGVTTPLLVNAQYPMRTVLRFDASQLAQAGITSARLRVFVKQVANPSGAAVPVPVHALTESWTEGTRNASTPANGATWNRRDGSVAWLTPGGSLAAPPAGTLSVPAGFGTGYVEADIAPLVRDWVSGATANNGIALLHGGTSPANDLLQIESRSVPANAPRLQVFYE